MSTRTEELGFEVASRRFGKYQVRRRLGAGGMAEVFLAEATDPGGRRLQVALKLLRPGAASDAFAGEADLMGLLEHPHLVHQLEFGEMLGRPFIAMEYLSGGDVRGLMYAHQRMGRPFPRDLGVHICLQALLGLAYFHRATTRTGRRLGLVHGDVNPENVFFSGEGEVKVGDFGVAKSGAVSLGMGDDVVAGKLRYLSPEQTRGERPTPATDLFAVGVMLHELTVGNHPFATPEMDERKLLEKLRAGRIEAPKETGFLGSILQRALHPSQDERYRTAGAFGADLMRYAMDHGRSFSNVEVRDYLVGVLGLTP